MSEYIIGVSAEVIERAKNGEKILITPKLTEVVRCRDCKRFDSKREGCWWFTHYEQRSDYSWEELPADVEPDGFCAWGVRKDD